MIPNIESGPHGVIIMKKATKEKNGAFQGEKVMLQLTHALFLLFRGFLLYLAMGSLSVPAYAGEAPKGQVKNLDDQIQEIKAETLNLGAQMRLLEEKLLYPSSTQLVVFVSLDSVTTFRPDSIEIELDGKTIAKHLYTALEFEALKKGGVQRIYTGNLKSGEHGLRVFVRGKTPADPSLRRTEQFSFKKDAGTRVLEVRLADADIDADARMITLRDW